MINPFRNLTSEICPFVSTSAYPAITKPKKAPRRKGFFNRLINLVDFNASPSSQVTIAKIEQLQQNSYLQHTNLQLDQTSESASNLLQSGSSLLQQGKLTEAIAHFRRAVQLEPNGEAYQYLAEALMQQGNLEDAAYYYRQAIALTGEATSENEPFIPQDSVKAKTIERLIIQSGNELQNDRDEAEDIEDLPWFEQASFHLQQAIVNCNAGDWKEAERACQLALMRLEPEAAMAYLILGRTLQGQKQQSDAEQAYRKALMLQPNAEIHARLGSLYTEQKQLSAAVQHYKAAIQLDPKFAGAYWKLAEVWQQLEAEAAAVSCWYQTFQLQPNWATAADYCRLADRLLKLSKLEAAQEYYGRAIQLNPHASEAYIGMGAILAQQGHQQAAIRYYQQVIQQNSQDEQIHLKLGSALAQLEQWQDALICYQRLIQLAPKHLEGLIGLQQCYMQLEQWQEALIQSRILVKLQAVYQNWHRLGDVLSRLQQWTEAVKAYEQAIALEPRFSWSHNNLGDALLQLAEWQQAVTAFRTAISLNPRFAWSHYNLGEALTRLQNWDGAVEAYRAALNLQPDLPHALGRLADVLQQRSTLDRVSALAFYQQAIQQDPTDPENYHKALELQPDAIELYLGLVEALIVHHRLDEAFVCCQLARQLQPDNATLITKLQYLVQQRELTKQPRTSSDADYQRWLQQHTPTIEELQDMAEIADTFAYQPLISILMPVYNTPEPFLRAAIQSVLNQVYPQWELCIADDASSQLNVEAILNEYTSQDSRIKIISRKENGHISVASNAALAQATGEYIALLDHDDILAPEALYEVVSLLNQHPEADFIYSDEDKLNEQDQRVQPFFKPEWCPDSFLSRMYTCHLGVYRHDLVRQVGGFRVGYEGSQDYDLVLRLSEHTNRIFHIAKVLYHWRMHTASTASNQISKPYAEAAAKRALTEACQRRGQPARTITTNPDFPGVYIVRYQLTQHKPVSIIIPTRNLGRMLDRCLQSIFEKSSYSNYEVILIDNNSDEIETFTIIKQWKQREPKRLKCYSLNIPFNYSKINNYASTKASGEYFLFLNNDIEVITTDWIEAMVEQAQRSSIGVVGAQLLYPDNTIQHAGVVLGIGGIAGHSHKYFPVNHHGYFSQLVSVNNYSAVTAACLMCRREVFEQVDGFDESLAVAFNDVDLCLRIKQLGYQNIYLPHAQLYHDESKSRGTEDTLEKQRRFKQEMELMRNRWGDLLCKDPCYSSHLTLEREDYSLRFE